MPAGQETRDQHYKNNYYNNDDKVPTDNTSDQFLQFSRLRNAYPACFELEEEVLGWQSAVGISMSLFGDGVRLIKSAKLCMSMQNTSYIEAVCLFWFHIQFRGLGKQT